MILLKHIKTYYDTIIRYYLSYYFSYYDTWDYYFSYYFSYYDILLFIIFLLFSIMTGCRQPQEGNVQTAIIDPFTEEWLISVDEECQLNCIDWKARIKNGKQPDAVFQDYYTHYFFYYANYFSWLARISVAVSTSYALEIYLHLLCELRQA